MADYNILFGGQGAKGMQGYMEGAQRGQALKMNELARQDVEQAQSKAGVTAAGLADKTAMEKEEQGMKMLVDKLEVARNMVPRTTQQNYGEYVKWATEGQQLPQEFFADPAEVAALTPQAFEQYKASLAQTADQFITQSADALKAGAVEKGKRKERGFERETRMMVREETSRSAKELKSMDIEQKQREQLGKIISDSRAQEAEAAKEDELDVDIKDLFGINDLSGLDPDTAQNMLDVADLAEDYMADDLSKVKAKNRAFREVMGEKAVRKKLGSEISGTWFESGIVNNIKKLVRDDVPVSDIYKKLRKEEMSDERARKLLGKAGFK